MKYRLMGLAALSLAVCAAPARAAEVSNGPWEFFGMLDYYYRSNIDDKVNNAYTDAVNAVGNASFDSTTTGGIGGRLGARKPVGGNRFDWGGSVSYVVGPKIDVNFTDNNPAGGTINETIKTDFLRLLAEAGVRFRMNDRAYFRLGGGAGWGRSTAKDDVSDSGAYAGSQSFTEHDSGFAWEITPSVVIAAGRASLELGLRYAQFPKIKETDNTVALDWKTWGAFIGAAF